MRIDEVTVQENITPDILADLIILAVLAKTSVVGIKTMIKTAQGIRKLKKMANDAGVALSSRVLGEGISRSEIMAKIKQDQQDKFINAALDALHRLVTSKGSRSSVGSYAFDISRTFAGINPKELEQMYYDKYGH